MAFLTIILVDCHWFLSRCCPRCQNVGNVHLQDNTHILTALYHGNIVLLGFALSSVACIKSVHLPNFHKNCNLLKKIASWNGYPKHVVSLLIKRFKQHQSTSNEDNNKTETNDNRPILWLEMPYIGTRGEQLLRGFKKKLLRCLNVNVQIKTRITTTKLNLFTNTKD